MPDLDTTLVDNEAGHTLGHIEERQEINSLRGRMLAAEAKNTQQDTTLGEKFTKNPNGEPLSFLSQAARDSLVQTDGTVLRTVKLTQAQYDALATKVATTLYLITSS